jgi:hypothetical protein
MLQRNERRTVMPGIADFIKNFTSPGSASGPPSVNPQQAAQYADRFTSTRPEDDEFNNQDYHQGAAEYLGQLPPEQFQQAAQNAYNNAPPVQQQGLVGNLLGSLAGKTGGVGPLASQLGLQSTNPQQMGAADYANMANYARTNHPDVLQDHVQSQPSLLKSMGHPILMGALGFVAARMAARMFRRAA